jgi:hypothetical protein
LVKSCTYELVDRDISGGVTDSSTDGQVDVTKRGEDSGMFEA